MRLEYEIPWDKAERGKYAKRFSRQTFLVAIDPDLKLIFPDADAVNTALHVLADVVRRGVRHRPRKKSA
jgi:hypothetical protein